MPLQVEGFKFCGNSRCPQINPQSVDHFHKDKNNNDGLTNRCKHCNNVRKIAWNKANPNKCIVHSKNYVRSGRRKVVDNIYYKNDKIKTKRADKQLRKLYGITLDQKQTMFDIQGGVCANLGCICVFKNLSDAHVDHNHKTNMVRSLLCGPCNRALGLLKDDIKRTIGLADYLQKHSTQ